MCTFLSLDFNVFKIHLYCIGNLVKHTTNSENGNDHTERPNMNIDLKKTTATSSTTENAPGKIFFMDQKNIN